MTKAVTSPSAAPTTTSYQWWSWLCTRATPTRVASAAAGCEVASLGRSYAESPKAYVDQLSSRFFRGAMPATLRSNLMELAAAQPTWSGAPSADRPVEGAVVLLHYALTSPFFGVMK